MTTCSHTSFHSIPGIARFSPGRSNPDCQDTIGLFRQYPLRMYIPETIPALPESLLNRLHSVCHGLNGLSQIRLMTHPCLKFQESASRCRCFPSRCFRRCCRLLRSYRFPIQSVFRGSDPRHVVDLPKLSFMKNQVYCGAVVMNMQPVADVLSIAVDRKLLVLQRVGNHQRYQLFRELIRPVVI